MRLSRQRPAKPVRRAAPNERHPLRHHLTARELVEHARQGRSDDAHAFVADPSDNRGRRVKDDLAEELGEDFVSTATSGESVDDERDATTEEEDGGPFVTTSAESQYASGTDASNPADAERAPFPTTQSEH